MDALSLLLGIMCLFCNFKDTQTCNIHVCLTWVAEQDIIVFRCKVNDLRRKVFIFNPFNAEQGHCLIPFPHSECYAFYTNTMYQDRRTNTTTLKVNGYDTKSIMGTWTCSHGTNRDKAVVNISILIEVREKNRTGSCGEEFFAWTMIGFLPTTISYFICLFIVHVSGKSTVIGIIYTRILKYYTFAENKHVHNIKPVMCAILLIFTFLFPFLYGITEKQCEDKKYYSAFGIVIAVICASCLSIKKKTANEDIRNTEPATFNLVSINMNVLPADEGVSTDKTLAHNKY